MPRRFNKQRRRISTEGSKHSFSMPRRLTTQANKVVRGEAWVPEVFPQAEASALPGDVSEVVEIFCQEEAERLQAEDDEVVAAAAAEVEHEVLGRSCTRRPQRSFLRGARGCRLGQTSLCQEPLQMRCAARSYQ